MKHDTEIVLIQPEIPQNSGNIVRTCKATNTPLTLVKPLGFQFNDKKLKRAGLDYWEDVDIKISSMSSFEERLAELPKPFYVFTSKSDRSFWDIENTEGGILIFGNESRGLPSEYYEKWSDHLVTIPMAPESRCLNLSNAVAIALYEALRKQSKLTTFLPQSSL